MILDKQRDVIPAKAVWIAEAIDSFMVMSHDSRNLTVVVDLLENPLANLSMALHLASLVERERSLLLEQACRQADLPDVMHKPA